MIAEPVTRNFIVPQGATYPIRMRWLIDNVPVNLTGATVRAQLRKEFDAPSPSLDCTLANGKASLDTTTGFFGFDLLASDTAAMEATSYFFDVVVTLTGNVTRAMQGIITLTPQVTR
ncbi:hypothetical protein EBZ38_01600 [bacterium]|nr:hypothetical protein [bacterium]